MKKGILLGLVVLLLGSVNLARAVDIVPATPTFISNPTLPPSFVNQSYSYIPEVVGGTQPYSFGITYGALPIGLSLNSSSGIISGTPTNAGTFNFTIQATDANSATGSQNMTLTIAPQSSGFIIYQNTSR